MLLISSDLSVDGDVEDNQEDEGDNAVDEKVKVNEIDLDVERVKSQRCWGYLLNLKLVHNIIINNEISNLLIYSVQVESYQLFCYFAPQYHLYYQLWWSLQAHRTLVDCRLWRIRGLGGCRGGRARYGIS